MEHGRLSRKCMEGTAGGSDRALPSPLLYDRESLASALSLRKTTKQSVTGAQFLHCWQRVWSEGAPTAPPPACRRHVSIT